jgi:hypothetical protein
MQHLNTYVFYLLGQRVGQIYYRARQPIKEWAFEAQVAHTVLQVLTDANSQFKLDLTDDAARNLLAVLEHHATQFAQDPDYAGRLIGGR